MTEWNATSETMHALSRQWSIDQNRPYSAEGKSINYIKLYYIHQTLLTHTLQFVYSKYKSEEVQTLWPFFLIQKGFIGCTNAYVRYFPAEICPNHNLTNLYWHEYFNFNKDISCYSCSQSNRLQASRAKH